MNVLRSFFVGCALLMLTSCGPDTSVERATDYERERRVALQNEPKQPSDVFDALDDRQVEPIAPIDDAPTFADNAPDYMDEEERQLLKEQEATRARHEALEKARNEDETLRQQKREAIERAADSFERQTNSETIDDSNRTSVPVDPSAPTSFERCDDLKQYYPNGVPEGHPAYRAKLDRDQNGWACEPPGH